MWAIGPLQYDYANFCEISSKDEKIFSTFKSDSRYSPIVSGVNQNQGQQYLEKLLNNKSDFIKSPNLQIAKMGDLFGKPVTFEYEKVGNISPVLLRYLSVLEELKKEFESLDNFSIVEIGAGFGDQCRLIQSFFKIKDYTIVDIPQALLLSKKYINGFGFEATPIKSDDVNQEIFNGFDLVISNYAISELSKDIQKIYLEKIIKNSKRGYITYNFLREDQSLEKPFSHREFKSELEKLGFSVKTYNENVRKSECEVLIWNS
jgi:putative sugar O-methyltransferase